MVLKKIYREGKKRAEWALVSKKTGRPLQYFGTRKPSKERFLAAERRVQMFKHLRRRVPKRRKDGVIQRYWKK